MPKAFFLKPHVRVADEDYLRLFLLVQMTMRVCVDFVVTLVAILSLPAGQSIQNLCYYRGIHHLTVVCDNSSRTTYREFGVPWKPFHWDQTRYYIVYPG